MSDFTIKDMLAMQQTLQEKYKDKWKRSAPKQASTNCYGCSVK